MFYLLSFIGGALTMLIVLFVIAKIKLRKEKTSNV